MTPESSHPRTLRSTSGPQCPSRTARDPRKEPASTSPRTLRSTPGPQCPSTEAARKQNSHQAPPTDPAGYLWSAVSVKPGSTVGPIRSIPGVPVSEPPLSLAHTPTMMDVWIYTWTVTDQRGRVRAASAHVGTAVGTSDVTCGCKVLGLQDISHNPISSIPN